MAERNTLAELRELNVRKQKAAQGLASAEAAPDQKDVNTSFYQDTKTVIREDADAVIREDVDAQKGMDAETEIPKTADTENSIDTNTSLPKNTEAEIGKDADAENHLDGKTSLQQDTFPGIQKEAETSFRTPTRRRPAGTADLEDTDKLTLALPRDLYRRLRQRGLEERRPARALMIDALIDYLDKVEGK